jgi:hypothetical protein
MSFLAPSDFTGKKAQTVNKFTEPKLQLYIDRYEPKYLRDLMGVDMYNDFVADLTPTPAATNSVPTDPKFTVIFNAFQIDEDPGTGCQHISEGIKEMLKFFIMFEYARDNNHVFGITGATSNNYSNSELLRLVKTQCIENFNTAVDTFKAIQWYIDDNPNAYDYTNYNGKNKPKLGWL